MHRVQASHDGAPIMARSAAGTGRRRSSTLPRLSFSAFAGAGPGDRESCRSSLCARHARRARARFVIDSRLIRGHPRRGQAETPLSPPFKFAETFCLSDPTPDNRRKAEAAAGLRALTGKAVGAAQREIARLKAEPAKPRMARDILKKRRRISRERRGGIRLDRAPSHGPAECAAMPSVQGQRPRAIANCARGRGEERVHRSPAAGSAPWPFRFTSRRFSKAVFNVTKGAYGWPRTWRELSARGI
jgi:hypothetical protein